MSTLAVNHVPTSTLRTKYKYKSSSDRMKEAVLSAKTEEAYKYKRMQDVYGTPYSDTPSKPKLAEAELLTETYQDSEALKKLDTITSKRSVSTDILSYLKTLADGVKNLNERWELFKPGVKGRKRVTLAEFQILWPQFARYYQLGGPLALPAPPVPVAPVPSVGGPPVPSVGGPPPPAPSVGGPPAPSVGGPTPTPTALVFPEVSLLTYFKNYSDYDGLKKIIKEIFPTIKLKGNYLQDTYADTAVTQLKKMFDVDPKGVMDKLKKVYNYQQTAPPRPSPYIKPTSPTNSLGSAARSTVPMSIPLPGMVTTPTPPENPLEQLLGRAMVIAELNRYSPDIFINFAKEVGEYKEGMPAPSAEDVADIIQDRIRSGTLVGLTKGDIYDIITGTRTLPGPTGTGFKIRKHPLHRLKMLRGIVKSGNDHPSIYKELNSYY